jgi:hypothetical protein
VLDQMSGLRIEQVINVAELMTGCEMRNKYPLSLVAYLHTWLGVPVTCAQLGWIIGLTV